MLYKFKKSDYDTKPVQGGRDLLTGSLNITGLAPSPPHSASHPHPRRAHTAVSRGVHPQSTTAEGDYKCRPVTAPACKSRASNGDGEEKDEDREETADVINTRRPQTAAASITQPSPSPQAGQGHQRPAHSQSARVSRQRWREERGLGSTCRLDRAKSCDPSDALASAADAGEQLIVTKDYDHELKKHGWRMEIPGDPLNLK